MDNYSKSNKKFLSKGTLLLGLGLLVVVAGGVLITKLLFTGSKPEVVASHEVPSTTPLSGEVAGASESASPSDSPTTLNSSTSRVLGTTASPTPTPSSSPRPTPPPCTSGQPSTSHSSLSVNPQTITANGSSTASTTVTLQDNSGCPTVGATLTLTNNNNGVISSSSPGSNITDNSGRAYFNYRAPTIYSSGGSVQDSISVSAQYSGSTTSFSNLGNVTLTPQTPGVSASNSTISASPTSQTAGQPVTITVTLKDNNSSGSQPVSGKNVSLSTSGTFSVTSSSGPSNSSGVVTFTVTSNTTGTDTFSATDTSDGITLSSTVSVTFN